MGGISDFNKYVFKNPFLAFLYGTIFTGAVQSSSVTASLVVPLVAEGKVSVKKSFPFIIGANIGTTITAAIAAIYKTEAAIALALVHFFFNLIGAVIFLPFPFLRNIPVKVARYVGKKALKQKFIGVAYILLTFFIIPFFLIYFNRN
jgi:sodium-dependent phosphate cotransporter